MLAVAVATVVAHAIVPLKLFRFRRSCFCLLIVLGLRECLSHAPEDEAFYETVVKRVQQIVPSLSTLTARIGTGIC